MPVTLVIVWLHISCAGANELHATRNRDARDNVKTIAYIVLAGGAVAVVMVLGFASDQFGPLGKLVLVMLVLSIFAVIGLTAGSGRTPTEAIPGAYEDQAGWTDWIATSGSNWLEIVVDHREMTRHISLEIDRSRRFGRTFTVIVITPELKNLADGGVDISSTSELTGVRQFVLEVAVGQLRTTDIIGKSANPLVTVALLPETGGDGANVAVERFREAMKQSGMTLGSGGKTEIEISVRAINYPDDVTDTTGFLETISEFEGSASVLAPETTG